MGRGARKARRTCFGVGAAKVTMKATGTPSAMAVVVAVVAMVVAMVVAVAAAAVAARPAYPAPAPPLDPPRTFRPAPASHSAPTPAPIAARTRR